MRISAKFCSAWCERNRIAGKIDNIRMSARTLTNLASFRKKAPIRMQPSAKTGVELSVDQATCASDDVVANVVRGAEKKIAQETGVSKTGESRVAAHVYEATSDDEIDLEEGDVLESVEDLGDGWSQGTNTRSGCSGLFPTSFTFT